MSETSSNLNIYRKIALTIFLIGFIVSAVLLILAFTKLLDFFIPIGCFLGSLLIGGSYFILFKIDDLNDDNQKLSFSMIVNGVRLFLLVSLTFVEVILQLKAAIMLFNPFAFVGAYLLGSIISIVFQVMEKKKC